MIKRALTLLAVCLLPVFPLQGKAERWPDGSRMGRWFSRTLTPERGRCFDITRYGAVPDSTRVQTEAIQRAIDDAAKKGGTVVIPAGVWLSGGLFFRKGTRLYLEEGAVLKGSTDIRDFPDTPVHIEGVLQPYASALINAWGCDGFSISGKGILDGNGLPYWEAFWTRRKDNPKCTNLEVRRPRMVSIAHSKNVCITGIRLRNAAFWNLHLYKCRRVYISGIDVYAPVKPVKAPSSDGIDLDACEDVHISGCSLATGDDLIALKGGKGPWATEDPDNGTNARILIENCRFGHGPGALVLGSECIGAENVILRRSKAEGTDRLLWLKMRPDTPQHYAHIRVEEVSGRVKNILYAKPWTQFFDLKGRTDLPVSVAEDITFQRCTLKCRRRRNVVEAPDQYTLSGIRFSGNKLSWQYNKDESKVKPYTLPDPLTFADGRPVATPADWPARRAEILQLFQQEMYGEMPPASPIYLETTAEGPALDGAARCRRVTMRFRPEGGPQVRWMLLYPAQAQGPVPAVLMLNYYGNDETLTYKQFPVPIRDILSRGLAFVTACYEDLSPDPDGVEDPREQLRQARTGLYELWPREITTGSLMAWAWALCRGMDLLEQDGAIDASRVLVTGSSRLGKAALLAGAFDQRFAVVVPNQTGGGGVPLSKRNFGESVSTEVEQFGYWWCPAFAKWAGAEAKMPFDQHLLLSCIAPRPLLVEGFTHPWFDARGEFLALKAASPVWTFLGAPGLPEVDFPHSGETRAIGPVLGYVKRKGAHGIDAQDWQWMLDFGINAYLCKL